MIAKIKPIETQYNGYRFRSRLEARWAVFLDFLNEEWEYEVEGYELPSGRYLPDFWLPRLYCWLEIKPVKDWPHKEVQDVYEICRELAEATGKPAAIAWGLPKAYQNTSATGGLDVYCFDSTDNSGGEQWWDGCFWAFDDCGKLCICSNNGMRSRGFLSPSSYHSFPGMRQTWEIQKPIDELYVDKAKSARFEWR
jgi:hypothetical protein